MFDLLAIAIGAVGFFVFHAIGYFVARKIILPGYHRVDSDCLCIKSLGEWCNKCMAAPVPKMYIALRIDKKS